MRCLLGEWFHADEFAGEFKTCSVAIIRKSCGMVPEVAMDFERAKRSGGWLDGPSRWRDEGIKAEVNASD